MLASIPRRSTRAGSSYICAACRCNLLGCGDAPGVFQSSSQSQSQYQLQLATFSTSTNYAVRSRKNAAKPAERNLQDSVALLKNLRQGFQEDLEAEVREEKNQGKDGDIAKNSREIQEGNGGQELKGEKHPTLAKSTPPKKKPKAAKAATVNKDFKAEKIATASVPKNREHGKEISKPAKLSRKERLRAKSEKNGKTKELKVEKVPTDSDVAFNRIPGVKEKKMEDKAPRPKKRPEKKVQFVGVDGQPFIIRRAEPMTSKAILKTIDNNTTRQDLVKIIESGSLSPADTVIAVRKLREKLITTNINASQAIPMLQVKEIISSQPVPEKKSSVTGGLPVRKCPSSISKGTPGPPLELNSMMTDLAAVRNEEAKKKKDVIRNGLKEMKKSKPAVARSGMTIKERMQAKPVTSNNSKGKTRSKLPYTRRLIAAGDPAETKLVKTGPLKVTKAQKKEGFQIETIVPDELVLVPVEKLDQEPVPKLVYGLDRVLFNPGVVHLQDPRSRVYNFDPYLQKITPVSEFNFNALKEYKTSSKDNTLIQLTKDQKKKYTGSTSSMSSALAHFHFLLSQWRPITTSMLSRTFPVEFNTFTKLQRGPTAVFLRWRDGAYAIDADKEYDSSTVLMMLGKSMEKLLTLPKDHYKKYLMENANNFPEEARHEPETFHYTTIGDFMLRSQLDAFDPRLPGTGMFDLKTRAVISVRMDTKGYQEGSGYEIKRGNGEFESYEREYYDMIRAAFLKYSLQVRMGRMDGIFVAFHNTERIFGFQYISLNEMDLALHGSEDTTIGDQEFKTSLDLLNQAINRVTKKYPEKSVRLHFETRPGDTPFMYIFAEPMEEEEIDKIQATNQEDIARFEEEVLGIKPKNNSLKEKKYAEWEELRVKVEESIEEDEMDIQEIRSIAENLLEESEYWDDLSPEEKQKCIESLVKSATLSEEPESTEEQNETVLVTDTDGQTDDDVLNEDEEAENDDESEINENDEFEIEADEEEQNVPEDFNLNQAILAESELETAANSFLQNSEATEAAENEMAETEGSTSDKSPSEQTTGELLEELLGESDTSAKVEEEVVNDETFTGQVQGVLQDKAATEGHQTEELLEDTDANSTVEEELSNEGNNNGKIVQDPLEDELDETDDLLTLEDEVKAYHEAETKEIAPPADLLAMTLTIRNKVDGEYVARPVDLSDGQKWTIEYALVDIAEKERSALLYEACKRRRFESLHYDEEGEPDPLSYNTIFMKELKDLAKKGRQWRNQVDKEDSKRPVRVLGWSDPVEIDSEGIVAVKENTEAEERE